MKRILFLIPFLATAAMLQATGPEAKTADNTSAVEPQARSAVLELAGAFSNDGYKIRDGFYFGELAPQKSVVIEVNLFAGNEYWFCAAANDPARKIAVKAYDEEGQPMEQQAYNDGARAATGVVAAASGKFLVQIILVDGKASTFCFLYCYK